MMKNIDQLAAELKKFNRAYRNGQPLISDMEYDRLVEQLRALDPQHPFLHTVEPEQFSARREIRHPTPMLSLEKAYTRQQLERFINRVQNIASVDSGTEILFRVTPKLDGLAARDDGNLFVSRGNGITGYEISSAFEKGVIAVGGRGQGLGEIVAVKSYFDMHLADKFEHPRNMVVGIVTSDTLNEFAQQALRDRAVHFVSYAQLKFWQGQGADLLQQLESINEKLITNTDYPMDGIVVEVVDTDIKQRMGATAHHYRWQIAVKQKGDTAETQVERVQWQVGRTGNVTPVLEVEPVSLSGATIRRVTAHHAGMLAKLQIDAGARIEIIRSGEVIPKLEQVIEPANHVDLPQDCPSCGQTLIWKGDFLVCSNSRDCQAQIEQRIIHWFRMLGNTDWFGIKTVQKLIANEYNCLEKIYTMTVENFQSIGFGPVQSKNLAEALQISLIKPVEDWRFLAALGISELGAGDSRKLLQHVSLEKILELEPQAIQAIHGFGEITSKAITASLKAQQATIEHLLSLGFNLERTPLVSEIKDLKSPINGKSIVFTGKMQSSNRKEMQIEARRLGAKIQTTVSRNTDYLVCGEKVGQSKLDKAQQLGVNIITESEYRQLMDGNK